ncbi:hypothetical protein UlMin_003228 [Ulmus minor]
MIISKQFLHAIFFLAITMVQAQDQSGFISIDCGTSDSAYRDQTTGIRYLPDTNFTETGENKDISSTYKLERDDQQQLWNVRSFPEGTRNCYTLKPTKGIDTRYLIRAGFMYGDYDNLGQPPVFDLYLGVDFWDTISFKDEATLVNQEIAYIPFWDDIYVCLVNTGNGIPFISVLELRPLNNDTYDSQTGGPLQLLDRYDFASANDRVMRYKDDPFDRFWSPFYVDIWKPLNTTEVFNSSDLNPCMLPFDVKRTAFTPNVSSASMEITLNKLKTTSRYFFFMHFAELQKLRKNQTREFNISINGDLWYGPLVPLYLDVTTIRSKYGDRPDSEGNIRIVFNQTQNSTLPPLINAMESFILKKFSGKMTNQEDVDAILNIKLVYGLKRNWQGDPCSPKAYRWNGLNCSYNPRRIISLNLSLSGLKGGISPYIADLVMLQSLDLSNNSLNGPVPEFLGQMSFLTVLNLKGNNLTGPVPAAILERSNNGSLTLWVDDYLINNQTLSTSGSLGKNKFFAPLVASSGGFLVHFVL